MKLAPLILSTIISLVLFIGGIVLLLSRIPFWSLFLGIASSQIGIIFLIFTYEKLSRDSVINTIANDTGFDIHQHFKTSVKK